MRSSRPNRRIACVAAALCATAATTCPRADDDAFGLGESLARGRFTFELRPRYNRIDESDKPERTQGGTVRVAAGWISAPFHDTRLTLEGIHTDHIGAKRFNDSGALSAASPYPLLPDPRYTGVNQANVELDGVDALRVKAGRQVVRVDNQRWVSDNGFRQIPQVFDGISVAYTGIEAAQLEAAR